MKLWEPFLDLSLVTKPNGDQSQDSHLRGEGFGGSNSMLTTSVQIDTELSGASDQRADSVDDGEGRHIILHCNLHCTMDIFGLTRLRHRHQPSMGLGKVRLADLETERAVKRGRERETETET
jgi:hypothetical protein